MALLSSDQQTMMIEVIKRTWKSLPMEEWNEIAEAMHITNGKAAKERMRYLMKGFINTDTNPDAKATKFTGKAIKSDSVEKKTRIILHMPQPPKTPTKRDRSESPANELTAKKRKTIGAPNSSPPPTEGNATALMEWTKKRVLESATLAAEEREELEEEITDEDLDKMFEDVKKLQESVLSDRMDWIFQLML